MRSGVVSAGFGDRLRDEPWNRSKTWLPEVSSGKSGGEAIKLRKQNHKADDDCIA